MSEEKKQGIPETDAADIIWESETEGGLGILGVDGMYANRRAAAWQRILNGSATEEDRAIVASLWTE
jgi:hypothetical protein